MVTIHRANTNTERSSSLLARSFAIPLRNAIKIDPSFNRKPEACAFWPNEANFQRNACGPTYGRCPALG